MNNSRPPAAFLFKGQLLHVVLLALLLTTVALLVDALGLRVGQFAGWTTKTWLIASLAVPVAHQFYVWIVWRSELCFGAASHQFGSAGFTLYRVGFMILFISRALVLIALGCADYRSLNISVKISATLATLLAIPAAYTFYSVIRYFGIARATGIDHFDPAYRTLPMVRQGIFRYTGNAMYTFGFLILWAIAFACSSKAALISAGFSHAYIWVHYFCTERPDMRFLYGEPQRTSR